MEPQRTERPKRPPVLGRRKRPWDAVGTRAAGALVLGGSAVGYAAAQPALAIALGLGSAMVSVQALRQAKSVRSWEPAEVQLNSRTVELGEVISGTYTRQLNTGQVGDVELKGELVCSEFYNSTDGWWTLEHWWKSRATEWVNRVQNGRVSFRGVRQPDDVTVKFDFEVAVPVTPGVPSFSVDGFRVEWELEIRMVSDGPDDVHRFPIAVLPVVHHTAVQ